jgi:membrane protease YdiL (CAAX protease family)
MLKGRFVKFDEKIRQRPEVKILVYFSLILTLSAIPYIYVTYQIGWPQDTINEGIIAAAAIISIFLMRSTPGALPPASYGLRIRGIVTQTAIGAGIGLALMSAIYNVLRVTGHYVILRRNTDFSPIEPLILFLFVAVLEETVFRGFIFVTLERKWGSFVAVTTTSLMFGLAHMIDQVPGISFAQHLRAALFIGFEAGIILNAAFMLTRSLWLGIGIHWAWNFFEGPFYGGTVSGMNEPSPLYVAQVSGPTLITGGAFGPEAGIVCLIICTFAGLIMLRLAIRAGEWQPNPEIKQENAS